MRCEGAGLLKPFIEIVDEDTYLGDAIARFLAAHGYTTSCFSSVAEYQASVPSGGPSITFVSFGLPNEGAEKILASAVSGERRTAVVMMSDGVETATIVQAVKLGAEDVVEKPFSAAELLEVISRLEENLANQDSVPTTFPDFAPELTEEERSILLMMEQGATIKEIAARLDVSVRTIHYRRASILEKTGCKTRTEAVAKLSSLRRNVSRPRGRLSEAF